MGLKLVYIFINFVIPLPGTYIRHSWGNRQRLPRRLVKQIQGFVGLLFVTKNLVIPLPATFIRQPIPMRPVRWSSL